MDEKTEIKEEVKQPTKAELAAEQRKNITVTTAEKEPPEEETTEEEVTEPEEETDPETEIEEDKEEIKETTKTEKELEAEKAAANTVAEKARIQRRIDKEVAKRKELEKENAELKAKLAANPDKDKLLTEEEVNSRAKTLAQQQVLQDQFIKDCNKLAADATKIDKDFKPKIDALAADVGPIPGQMIGILSDLDNGGEVLAYFTKDENIDDYEKIITMTPGKMGVELAKISNKLVEAKKPKQKEISKVPDPNEPVGGNSRSGNLDPAVAAKKGDMKEFARIRQQQTEQRRKEKMRIS